MEVPTRFVGRREIDGYMWDVFEVDQQSGPDDSIAYPNVGDLGTTVIPIDQVEGVDVLHREEEPGRVLLRGPRAALLKGESFVGMNKSDLLRVLAVLAQSDDPERAHGEADNALLNFINDPEIREAFDRVKRWYA